MTDQTTLRAAMQAHLEHVRTAAGDNEFVDAAEAIRLHTLLAEALDSWDDLDAEQRTVLSDAVTYLVRTDDEEDDLRSPIGFEDDAEVVEAALTKIRRSGTG
jgi:hypothetical protein